MNVGAAIRAARRRAGLTQAEVATGAGTSQTAVAAYENGRKSPNLATLVRLSGAMGATLHVGFDFVSERERTERPTEALSMEERRSLWLHRAIAARIQDDPERAMVVARGNLAIRRRADRLGQGESWRRAWEVLLDGPLEALLASLCSTGTFASQLRQSAPFAGLLTPRERWAVYRSFTRAENPSAVPA